MRQKPRTIGYNIMATIEAHEPMFAPKKFNIFYKRKEKNEWSTLRVHTTTYPISQVLVLLPSCRIRNGRPFIRSKNHECISTNSVREKIWHEISLKTSLDMKRMHGGRREKEMDKISQSYCFSREKRTPLDFYNETENQLCGENLQCKDSSVFVDKSVRRCCFNAEKELHQVHTQRSSNLSSLHTNVKYTVPMQAASISPTTAATTGEEGGSVWCGGGEMDPTAAMDANLPLC
jgi:hypothetical protein